MHRIDTPGNSAGLFTDGNPYTTPKTPGTIAGAAWLNALQEELAGVVEATGVALDKSNNGQLLEAVRELARLEVAPVTRLVRRIVPVAFGATVDSFGLGSPTLDSPGAGAAALQDGDGHYVELTYDQSAGQASGVALAQATQRRHDPDLVVAFRAPFINNRLWVGLFTGDPSGSDALGAIEGVGVRFNVDVDGANYQAVQSDGATQTEVDTGVQAAANSHQAFRMRHVASGSWEVSIWDHALNRWAGQTTLDVAGPGPSDTLGIYARLADVSGASDRAISFQLAQLSSD